MSFITACHRRSWSYCHVTVAHSHPPHRGLHRSARLPGVAGGKTRSRLPENSFFLGRKLSEDVNSTSRSFVGRHRAFCTTPKKKYASSLSSNSEGESSTSDLEESELLRLLEEEKKRNSVNDEAVDVGSYINPNDLASFRSEALSQWPTPCSERPLPSGWSRQWDQWPYLMTLYWPSPYFLMLPQIEMVVNLMFGVKAETRPLAFWKGEGELEKGVGGVFVFTLKPVGETSETKARFFLLDSIQQELYEFSSSDAGVTTEDELVQYLHTYSTPEELFESPQVRPMNPSGTGMKLVGRILERDEGVIEDLERGGWVNARLPLSKEDGRKLKKTEIWEERPDVLKRLLTAQYNVDGGLNSEANGDGRPKGGGGIWELGEVERTLEREAELDMLRSLTEKVREEVEDIKKKY
ncbi:hypothetical protein BDN72DRAFT_846168 [Pluteus cervinus]|uniref:Uncharacterized protein n=1 Tax=Pluteus cervinus TaxID=181527 RepID=A0ACD3AHV2_9AGAR|nr:hypothetical protein BDN72DRAFT_846168 [Pluteus cervinus]